MAVRAGVELRLHAGSFCVISAADWRYRGGRVNDDWYSGVIGG